MSVIACRIIVQGTVQGVGFRYFVTAHAERLMLDGFVRNRRDGSVEALCVGMEAQVEELIAHCRIGPKAAQVQKVDVQPAQGLVDKGFRQLSTV